MKTHFRTVHHLTIRCPIDRATLRLLGSGDAAALARDPAIAPILRLIESTPEFGDFGTYTGVCEVTVGLEAFTPGRGADPSLGEVGRRAVSPTATVTTYLASDIGEDRLAELIEALAEVHPWEVPVIELGATRLRAARS